MKRSLGVTVIAVLSLIGSILTLLVGILVLVVMAFASPPPANGLPTSPVVLKLMLVLAALVYMVPAIWGIITSVGLFRLSNWARISIIVFSVLLVLMSGFSGLTMFFLPVLAPNSALNPATKHAIQAVMGLFWAALFGMGVWWLIFFTRAGVSQQFLARGAALTAGLPETQAANLPQSATLPVLRTPERPVSLTVIAWFLLVGCLFIPVNLVLHFPAVLFTRLVTGWVATWYYLGLTVLAAYVGFGLLRFKPYARELGITYFLFLTVNASIFYFAPGGRGRMKALLDAQSEMFPWMRFWQPQPELHFDLTPFLFICGAIGVVFLLVPLYFLITRKQAFEAAASLR